MNSACPRSKSENVTFLTNSPSAKQSANQSRSVEDYPPGFPKISCFLDSDDAFMVYRRFGSVYSRLLLSKQDELGRMEALLLAMDRTDLADGNGNYLKSRPLDVARERIPEEWEGVSRVALLERMEKVALEYGMYWNEFLSYSTTYFELCVLCFIEGAFDSMLQRPFLYMALGSQIPSVLVEGEKPIRRQAT